MDDRNYTFSEWNKKFCEIKGENLVKSRNFSEWVFLDIVEKNLKDVIEKIRKRLEIPK